MNLFYFADAFDTKDNIINIRIVVYSITIKYEGEFKTVEYEPSDDLQESLILPILIDKEKNTITFAGGAKNIAEPRKSKVVLGNLIFNKDSKITK